MTHSCFRCRLRTQPEHRRLPHRSTLPIIEACRSQESSGPVPSPRTRIVYCRSFPDLDGGGPTSAVSTSNSSRVIGSRIIQSSEGLRHRADRPHNDARAGVRDRAVELGDPLVAQDLRLRLELEHMADVDDEAARVRIIGGDGRMVEVDGSFYFAPVLRVVVLATRAT